MIDQTSYYGYIQKLVTKWIHLKTRRRIKLENRYYLSDSSVTLKYNSHRIIVLYNLNFLVTHHDWKFILLKYMYICVYIHKDNQKDFSLSCVHVVAKMGGGYEDTYGS